MISEQQFCQIKDLYESGYKTTNIAKLLNLKFWDVQTRIRNIRSNITKQHFQLMNENFFETLDTEEKAYWIGFIYADGSLYTGYTLSITLSVKDRLHLQKLSNIFGKEAKERSSFLNEKEYKQVRLNIYNKKIYNDLKKLGIENQKTYSESTKIIEMIPKNLISHFIRGIFDGDGNIHKDKNNNGHFSICGNEDILNKIQMILIEDVGLTKTKIYQLGDAWCWNLLYGGNISIKKIYEYLYKDSYIYLERKKIKFEEII